MDPYQLFSFACQLAGLLSFLTIAALVITAGFATRKPAPIPLDPMLLSRLVSEAVVRKLRDVAIVKRATAEDVTVLSSGGVFTNLEIPWDSLSRMPRGNIVAEPIIRRHVLQPIIKEPVNTPIAPIVVDKKRKKSGPKA